MSAKTVKVYFYKPIDKTYKPQCTTDIPKLGDARFFPMGMYENDDNGVGNINALKRWLRQGNATEKVLYVDESAIDLFGTKDMLDFIRKTMGWLGIKPSVKREECPLIPSELKSSLERISPSDLDDIILSIGKDPKLVLLAEYKESEMTILDNLQNYVNEITENPNGIDGVFILNAEIGADDPVICKSTTKGAGATFELGKIGEIAGWTSENVLRDDVSTLLGVLNVKILEHTTYRFDNALLRLHYITNDNCSVVVGFISGDLKTAALFGTSVPKAFQQIREAIENMFGR